MIDLWIGIDPSKKMTGVSVMLSESHVLRLEVFQTLGNWRSREDRRDGIEQLGDRLVDWIKALPAWYGSSAVSVRGVGVEDYAPKWGPKGHIRIDQVELVLYLMGRLDGVFPWIESILPARAKNAVGVGTSPSKWAKSENLTRYQRTRRTKEKVIKMIGKITDFESLCDPSRCLEEREALADATAVCIALQKIHAHAQALQRGV